MAGCLLGSEATVDLREVTGDQRVDVSLGSAAIAENGLSTIARDEGCELKGKKS